MRDFEPLLPTIEASAEFPSEHACHRTPIMKFIDLYQDEVYGVTLEKISHVFENMEDFHNQYAISRLMGGYHYLRNVLDLGPLVYN